MYASACARYTFHAFLPSSYSNDFLQAANASSYFFNFFVDGKKKKTPKKVFKTREQKQKKKRRDAMNDVSKRFRFFKRTANKKNKEVDKNNKNFKLLL